MVRQLQDAVGLAKVTLTDTQPRCGTLSRQAQTEIVGPKTASVSARVRRIGIDLAGVQLNLSACAFSVSHFALTPIAQSYSQPPLWSLAEDGLRVYVFELYPNGQFLQRSSLCSSWGGSQPQGTSSKGLFGLPPCRGPTAARLGKDQGNLIFAQKPPLTGAQVVGQRKTAQTFAVQLFDMVARSGKHAAHLMITALGDRQQRLG
jgi:hypothetical protein